MSKIHLGAISVSAGDSIYYVTWKDGIITMTTKAKSRPMEWSYDPGSGQLSATPPPDPLKPLIVVAGNHPSPGSDVVFWDETGAWKSWTISGSPTEGFVIRLTSKPDLYLSIQNIATSKPQQMLVADQITMQTMGNFYYVFQFTKAPNVPIPVPSCPPCPKCPIDPLHSPCPKCPDEPLFRPCPKCPAFPLRSPCPKCPLSVCPPQRDCPPHPLVPTTKAKDYMLPIIIGSIILIIFIVVIFAVILLRKK